MKKKERIKKKDNKMALNKSSLNMGQVITTIYGVLLFTLFLGYTWNGYGHILEAKTACYAIMTALYIVLGVIALLFSMIKDYNFVWLKDKFYCFLGIFFLGCIISSLCSGDFRATMNAVDGKRFGLTILTLCIISCVITYATFSWNKILVVGIFIGSILFSFLTLCNRYGMDLLGFYIGIQPGQIKGFLATFGQMNLVSEFLCICLALWAGLYVLKEDSYEIIYAIALFLSSAAGLASASEGFFLGIFATVIFIFFFSFERMEDFFQFVKMITIMTASLVFLYLTNHIFVSTIQWDAIHEFLFSVYGLLTCILLCAIMWGIYFALKKKDMGLESRKKVRNIFVVVLSACLALVILIMILCTNQMISLPENIEKYFLFGDSWGTNRGFVWIRTLKEYAELPLLEKLFGCGLGGFGKFFAPYYEESIQSLGYYFIDAHNVFLQFLVTLGLFGSISFYALIIYVIVRHIKNYPIERKELIPACLLCVWLLQSMINNPIVMNMSYVFYILAWRMKRD